MWRGEIAPGNRGFENLDKLLGWAVEPEHAYETEFQCEAAGVPSAQRCFLRDAGRAVISLSPGGRRAVWP